MSLKIAVIGAGGMLQYHAKGFVDAGAEIASITDMNAEAAESAAKEWKAKESYTDVAEMLEKSDCDAVSIIVPNKFHAPLAIQCLNAGKHVFCEKPPAISAAEVEQMIAAAKKADKHLMFNFNNRARPESYAMMKAIEDGVIGDINSAQAKWIRRTGIPGFGGWFTTKELSGGGPLIDLLHMVDLAMHFMGYPEPAHVLGQTFDNFITDKNFKGPWGIPDKADGITDVESAAHAMVSFKTGQVLSLQASWAEMIKREEVSVVFQGTLGGGKVETVAVEACEDMGRARSAQNFVLAIEGKEPPLNTPDQALALMKIIDAIYESANSGAPVSL